MARHPVARSTGKLGVTFVCEVVEGGNCIFHKIGQENDLGVDGIIELIRNEQPLNKQLAVQVKSGESYFDARTQECVIPVGGHSSYWSQHPLPVYGIVVVPSQRRAFWVDIKQYLANHPDCSTIRYPATEVSSFDGAHFLSVFVPLALRETPDITFSQAISLFGSLNDGECLLGLVVLFRRFPNRSDVWDEFIKYFFEQSADKIPSTLMYYFAHVPWHPDIAGVGEQLTDATRDYVRTKFETFGKAEVAKLLSFIDEENMIARGTIGQSVEAIISSLPNMLAILVTLLEDENQSLSIREAAALIFAMHSPSDAIPYLESISAEGSWYIGEVLFHVKEWGGFNPYG